MAIKTQYAVAMINEDPSLNTGVSFSASAQESSILNCCGTTPVGLFLPANWTDCSISFAISKDGVHFYKLANLEGLLYSVAPAIADVQAQPLIPAVFINAIYIKLVCGTPQAQECFVDISLAPIFQGIHN